MMFISSVNTAQAYSYQDKDWGVLLTIIGQRITNLDPHINPVKIINFLSESTKGGKVSPQLLRLIRPFVSHMKSEKTIETLETMNCARLFSILTKVSE